MGLKLPDTLEGWSNWLVTSEYLYGTSKNVSWLTHKDIRKIAIMGTYLGFFMYPDSFHVYATTLWRKIGFKIGEFIAKLRWKFEFLDYDIDLWIYNYVRKYAKIG